MALWAATAEAAAVAATMTTLLEIDPPASRFAQLVEFGITFSGISSTDIPVLVQLVQVTATSAVGTAVTPVTMRDNQGAVAAGAKKLPATEGTVAILETWNVPPSSGLVIQFPLGREPRIIGAGSTASGLAIRANRGTGAAINADVNLVWEE